jgi:hypothetical protein
LTEDLIDHLQAEDPQALAGTNAQLRIEARELVSVVESNMEYFIRDNMVKKGHTREEAEKDVAVLPLLLAALGQVDLTMKKEEEGLVAELLIDFSAESEATGAAPAHSTP